MLEIRQTFSSPQAILLWVFAAVMVATRYFHFGAPPLFLPDASLAIFFLAGLYMRRAIVFPALLIVAGVIDYLAINVGGVSDWCFSPAYWFLIPTYAGLWFGGRYCAANHALSLQSLLRLGTVLLVASSAAFVISNGSFYLFSGRYADMSWAEYTSAVMKYYAPYMASAFIYTGVALMAEWALAQTKQKGIMQWDGFQGK